MRILARSNVRFPLRSLKQAQREMRVSYEQGWVIDALCSGLSTHTGGAPTVLIYIHGLRYA